MVKQSILFCFLYHIKEKVTLDANSDGAICLRISDTNGRILLDEKTIQPGTDLEMICGNYSAKSLQAH